MPPDIEPGPADPVLIRCAALPGQVRVTLGAAPAHPFYLARWRSAQRRFRLGLRRLAALRDGEGGLLPAPLAAETRADLLRLDRQLCEILYPPLSASAVVEVLAITPAERRAWSDGLRLPLPHHALARRGQRSYRYPAYDGRTIALIAERPDLIAGWRAEDAAARPAPE